MALYGLNRLHLEIQIHLCMQKELMNKRGKGHELEGEMGERDERVWKWGKGKGEMLQLKFNIQNEK